MASDPGPDAVEWGTSSGRFGSPGSEPDAGPSEAGPAPRRSSFGRGSPSSFGSRGGGQRKARSGGRRGGARRAPADDPFGPVVGSAADAPPADDVAAFDADAPDGPWAGAGRRRSAGSGSSGAGTDAPLRADSDAPPGRRGRTGRSGRRPAGSAGPGGADPSEHGVVDKSDEEWTSEARSVLLRQLALGARSRHQLDRKLAERSVPPAVASALLDRFEEVQLIDDAEFARMWVRTRTAAKSLSRSSLRRELAEKGIDGELAEDALLQLSDEDEHEQARDVVRRKLRRSADLTDRAVRDKEVRRLVGVLARKGYSPGAAFSIVKDVLAEADAG
ncbi:regulatory protein RecX [Arthrobacter agilis]|uniref:regulatory protein RecX n=1 Tax=Arthrobacter agilis TaxID=37921 RepID=UPI00277D2CA0|nr:regulatory protein RecX [Arthrobacter agilis]MDQ0734249.1 SOS response regulatory protein OraA/RecX [Arthrobacter agilis]